MIKWLDSSETHGWVEKDNLKAKIEEIESVGFIVHETDELIVISNAMHQDAINSPFTIPKFAIKKIMTFNSEEMEERNK